MDIVGVKKNGFVRGKMLPVIVFVDGDLSLFTPGMDSKPTGFLLCETGSPLPQMSLMEFLLCIHKITSHLIV